MTRVLTALLLVGLCCASSSVLAQRVGDATLQRNSHIRFTRDTARELTVLSIYGDSIFAKTKISEPGVVILRAQDVSSLQVRERIGKHTARGALIGLGIGAAVGAILGFGLGDDEEGLVRFSAGFKAGAFGLVGGVGGSVVGALSAPPRYGQWVQAQLPRVR